MILTKKFKDATDEDFFFVVMCGRVKCRKCKHYIKVNDEFARRNDMIPKNLECGWCGEKNDN